MGFLPHAKYFFSLVSLILSTPTRQHQNVLPKIAMTNAHISIGMLNKVFLMHFGSINLNTLHEIIIKIYPNFGFLSNLSEGERSAASSWAQPSSGEARPGRLVKVLG